MKATIALCNICSCNAAEALARLTDKTVQTEVPLLHPLDELPELMGEQWAVAVHLGIFGNLGGRIMMLLPEGDARVLLQLLLGEAATDLPLSELEESALKEVGNIMASACLNALAMRLKTVLLPSVPELAVGTAPDLVAEGGQAVPGASVAIEARFSIAAPSCRGSLILIPSPPLLDATQAHR